MSRWGVARPARRWGGLWGVAYAEAGEYSRHLGASHAAELCPGLVAALDGSSAATAGRR